MLSTLISACLIAVVATSSEGLCWHVNGVYQNVYKKHEWVLSGSGTGSKEAVALPHYMEVCEGFDLVYVRTSEWREKEKKRFYFPERAVTMVELKKILDKYDCHFTLVSRPSAALYPNKRKFVFYIQDESTEAEVIRGK